MRVAPGAAIKQDTNKCTILFVIMFGLLIAASECAATRGPRALLQDFQQQISDTEQALQQGQLQQQTTEQQQPQQHLQLQQTTQQQQQKKLEKTTERQQPGAEPQQQQLGDALVVSWNCEAGCEIATQLVCVEGGITLQNPCLAFCQGLAVAYQGPCVDNAGNTSSTTIPFADAGPAASTESGNVFSIQSFNGFKSESDAGSRNRRIFPDQMQRLKQSGFVLVGEAEVDPNFVPRRPRGLRRSRSDPLDITDSSYMQPMRLSALDHLVYVAPRRSRRGSKGDGSGTSDPFVAIAALSSSVGALTPSDPNPPSVGNSIASDTGSSSSSNNSSSSDTAPASSSTVAAYQLFPLNQTSIPEPRAAGRRARVQLRRSAEVKTDVAFPYNAIGKLTILDYTGFPKGHCTATWIGDYAVITAAHCIYDREERKFVDPKDMRFEPAAYTNSDGVHITPYGVHSVADVHYLSGWVTASDEKAGAFDMAVVTMNEMRRTGKLGFAWDPTGYGGVVNHAGYPGLSPPTDAQGRKMTMYKYGSCNIQNDGSGSDRVLLLQSATSTPCKILEVGESGSAMFEMRGNMTAYLLSQIQNSKPNNPVGNRPLRPATVRAPATRRAPSAASSRAGRSVGNNKAPRRQQPGVADINISQVDNPVHIASFITPAAAAVARTPVATVTDVQVAVAEPSITRPVVSAQPDANSSTAANSPSSTVTQQQSSDLSTEGTAAADVSSASTANKAGTQQTVEPAKQLNLTSPKQPSSDEPIGAAVHLNKIGSADTSNQQFQVRSSANTPKRPVHRPSTVATAMSHTTAIKHAQETPRHASTDIISLSSSNSSTNDLSSAADKPQQQQANSKPAKHSSYKALHVASSSTTAGGTKAAAQHSTNYTSSTAGGTSTIVNQLQAQSSQSASEGQSSSVATAVTVEPPAQSSDADSSKSNVNAAPTAATTGAFAATKQQNSNKAVGNSPAAAGAPVSQSNTTHTSALPARREALPQFPAAGITAVALPAPRQNKDNRILVPHHVQQHQQRSAEQQQQQFGTASEQLQDGSTTAQQLPTGAAEDDVIAVSRSSEQQQLQQGASSILDDVLFSIQSYIGLRQQHHADQQTDQQQSVQIATTALPADGNAPQQQVEQQHSTQVAMAAVKDTSTPPEQKTNTIANTTTQEEPVVPAELPMMLMHSSALRQTQLPQEAQLPHQQTQLPQEAQLPEQQTQPQQTQLPQQQTQQQPSQPQQQQTQSQQTQLPQQQTQPTQQQQSTSGAGSSSSSSNSTATGQPTREELLALAEQLARMQPALLDRSPDLATDQTLDNPDQTLDDAESYTDREVQLLLPSEAAEELTPQQPTNFIWTIAATAEEILDDTAFSASSRKLLAAALSDPAIYPARSIRRSGAARSGNRGANRAALLIRGAQGRTNSLSRSNNRRQGATSLVVGQQQQQQRANIVRQPAPVTGPVAAGSNQVEAPLYLIRGVLSHGAPLGPNYSELDVATELDQGLYEFIAKAAASTPDS